MIMNTIMMAGLVIGQIGAPIPGLQPAPEVKLKDAYASVDLAQGPVYESFMRGFVGPFVTEFQKSSRGLMPSRRCVEEAGSLTFSVMVEHHFGELTISEVRELLSCECDKRLMKLVNFDEPLRKKLDKELKAFAIRASENKAAYIQQQGQ